MQNRSLQLVLSVFTRMIYFQSTENEKEQRHFCRAARSFKVSGLIDLIENMFFNNLLKRGKESIYLASLGFCLMIIIIAIKIF